MASLVEINEIVIDDTGRPVSGASVQVNNRGGGVATIYNSSGAVITNPTVSSGGNIDAWVYPGSYDLVVNVGGRTYTHAFEASSGADLKALEAKQPTLVTALPASPVDGQEVYYTSPYGLWHLRYNATSGFTYKWDALSAPPTLARIDPEQTTTSTSYTDLTTVGPSVTAPLAGDYLCQWGARAYNNTPGSSAFLGLAAGAVEAVDIDAAETHTLTAFQGFVPNLSAAAMRSGVLANTTIRLRYRAGPGGTAVYQKRWLIITPLRVG